MPRVRRRTARSVDHAVLRAVRRPGSTIEMLNTTVAESHARPLNFGNSGDSNQIAGARLAVIAVAVS